MEAARDPAFYTDGVLHSDEDEGELVPQVTLKLLADFPEPLTEPQRRAVQHHVAQQVREFELVHRQVAIVERGYLALLRVVKRLRRERQALQASLEAPEAKPTPPSQTAAEQDANTTTTTATTPPNAAAAAAVSSSSTSANAPAPASASAVKEPAGGPKRRTGGLLLRSSVFSGLQRVLQAAKTEQHDERAEQLARQRERIAKESRLHVISQDLATQEALLEPLQRTYTRAVALAEAAAGKAAPLLELLEEMWDWESRYPSRFSMQAAGTLTSLLCASGADPADADEGKPDEDEEGRVPHSQSGANGGAAAFVVPFTPAQYTTEVEDRVRAQVEEVIDDYLAYRTRIDPLLDQLEQAQQMAKAVKVEELMDIIGAKETDVRLPADRLDPAAALVGQSAGEMLTISGSDDDDDVMLGMAKAAGGDDAAETDRQDREHIRTALTALDDFEDA